MCEKGFLIEIQTSLETDKHLIRDIASSKLTHMAAVEEHPQLLHIPVCSPAADNICCQRDILRLTGIRLFYHKQVLG